MSHLWAQKTSEELEWEREHNITIELATDNDYEEVKDFVDTVFSNDAPLSR